MTEPKNSESDVYGGAFYVPTVTDDMMGIETDQAARALAQPGLTIAQAAMLWRNLLRDGYIHPYYRRATGKRPYLFRADQVVCAAVIHRLSELGDSSQIRRAASLAMLTWRADDLGRTEDDIRSGAPIPPVPRSPAMWALKEYLQGTRNLSFQLRTLRSDTHGTVTHVARVCDMEGNGGTFMPQPEAFKVRSAIVIDMDSVLEHVTRAKAVQ